MTITKEDILAFYRAVKEEMEKSIEEEKYTKWKGQIGFAWQRSIGRVVNGKQLYVFCLMMEPKFPIYLPGSLESKGEMTAGELTKILNDHLLECLYLLFEGKPHPDSIGYMPANEKGETKVE